MFNLSIGMLISAILINIPMDKSCSTAVDTANCPDGGCPVSHQHIVDLEIVCCWIMVALNYTS